VFEISRFIMTMGSSGAGAEVKDGSQYPELRMYKKWEVPSFDKVSSLKFVYVSIHTLTVNG